MSHSLATVPSVRFHISLNVTDLAKSVDFYRTLFNVPPAKQRPDYAKFEPDEPALVLSLEPNGMVGGGALNHLGIRLPDSRTLVAAQERLERAGILSQREEGVECCYARQTKFWVHDPDGTMWELYTLDDDHLDHRGSGMVPEGAPKMTSAIWEHRLGMPIPDRHDAADATLDEVRLRGSLNVPLTEAEQSRLLAESLRTLKPGGKLLLHMLTGEQAVVEPKLPGIAAPVTFVPATDEVLASLNRAGFADVGLVKSEESTCFKVRGVAMRETQIEGRKITV